MWWGALLWGCGVHNFSGIHLWHILVASPSHLRGLLSCLLSGAVMDLTPTSPFTQAGLPDLGLPEEGCHSLHN